MWMLRRYAALWKNFKEREFNVEEASKILNEDKTILLVLFSQLRKRGLLVAEFDQADARKRLYRLNNPEQMMEVLSNEN